MWQVPHRTLLDPPLPHPLIPRPVDRPAEIDVAWSNHGQLRGKRLPR
jgi:hypothetical protein